MVISHNVLAMNANRMLGINTKSKAKSTEKLSSGYRINRAADDAAGLAISEKMRRQIRGLTQASENCQDGVSFNQIADGAMNEISDMLHRMEELAVKSANGTNTEDDRSYIQMEIQQIKDEIDHIAERTEFNEQPVFGWGRAKTNYVTNPDGSTSISSTEEYLVTTINYGLTDVIGIGHIYNGTKLNDPLTFDLSGWHSTGENLYTSDTPYSSRIYGRLDEDDIATSLSNKTKGISASTIKTEIETGCSTLISNNSYSGTLMDTNGDEYKLTLSATGKKDLNGLPIPDSISFQKVKTIVQGVSTPVNGSKSTYYLGNYSIGATGIVNGNPYGSVWIDFSGLDTGDYQLGDLVGKGFNTTCATCNKHYSIYFTNSGSPYTFSGNDKSPRLDINISSCTSGEDIVSAIMNAVSHSTSFDNHYQQYAYNDNNKAMLYIYDNRNEWVGGRDSKFEPAARDVNNKLIINKSTVHNPHTGKIMSETTDSMGIWIQAGTEAYDGFYMRRARVSTSSLDIDTVNVSTAENAQAAISAIKEANAILGEQRAMVGAQQNRLEHTIKNLDNIVENTTAAESRIRDTDMAKEMVAFSNLNVLEQAGQAMLAQANQSKQGILSLLQ